MTAEFEHELLGTNRRQPRACAVVSRNPISCLKHPNAVTARVCSKSLRVATARRGFRAQKLLSGSWIKCSWRSPNFNATCVICSPHSARRESGNYVAARRAHSTKFFNAPRLSRDLDLFHDTIWKPWTQPGKPIEKCWKPMITIAKFCANVPVLSKLWPAKTTIASSCNGCVTAHFAFFHFCHIPIWV